MKTSSRIGLGVIAAAMLFAGAAQAKGSLFLTLNPRQATALSKALMPRMKAAVRANAAAEHVGYRAYRVGVSPFGSDHLNGKLITGGIYGLELKPEQGRDRVMYLRLPGTIGFGVNVTGRGVNTLAKAATWMPAPVLWMLSNFLDVKVKVTDSSKWPTGQYSLK